MNARTPTADPGMFQKQRVLCLSPHPDDLAFSMHGPLTSLARNCDVECATVFSLSLWAPYAHIAEANVDAISELRAEEERRYCSQMGISLTLLGLPDASLRGHDARTERQADPANDPMRGRLFESLDRLMARREFHLMVIPAAVGDHIDHLLVHAAAFTLRPYAVEVISFEDQPYAADYQASQTEEIARRRHPGAIAKMIPIPGGLDAKLELLAIYDSQVRAPEEAAVKRYTMALSQKAAFERIWCEDSPAIRRALHPHFD